MGEDARLGSKKYSISTPSDRRVAVYIEGELVGVGQSAEVRTGPVDRIDGGIHGE